MGRFSTHSQSLGIVKFVKGNRKYLYRKGKGVNMSTQDTLKSVVDNAILYHFVRTMLDNQCPTEVLEDGYNKFVFEMCCDGEVEVIARKEINWNIESVQFVPQR